MALGFVDGWGNSAQSPFGSEQKRTETKKLTDANAMHHWRQGPLKSYSIQLPLAGFETYQSPVVAYFISFRARCQQKSSQEIQGQVIDPDECLLRR